MGAALIAAVVIAAGGAAFYRFGRPQRVPEPAPAPRKISTPVPVESALPEPEPPPVVAAASGALDLPNDAPREVHFGVILVAYQGAEMAPGNAPAKSAALARAQSLLTEAQQNFDEAVKKGDRGSTADAGTMPRGVLEPALEFALFSLKKGEVHGSPLDTPRGFWILRRNQ